MKSDLYHADFEEKKGYVSPPQLNPEMDSSWKEILKEEFNKPYFLELKSFLVKEQKDKKVIYPRGSLIFNAFNLTPFDQVKVVILGQDPYHGKGQAHGLCFSVPDGISSPPSLVNIFKELKYEMGISVSSSGNLERWAKQGVLLLNSILTVRAGSPASHHGKGWEIFTDEVIKKLSENKSGLVFLLWGRYAQDKGALINNYKHLILKSAHPSPFSADKFFGCNHFIKTNQYLKETGKGEIQW